MFQLNTHRNRQFLQWSTVALGMLSLLIVTVGFTGDAKRPATEGLLMRRLTRQRTQWETVTEQEILSGATIPANTHVIIHLPDTMPSITRRTLFGRRGTDTRYWGYCFPPDLENREVVQGRGFPGTLFLSEKHREQERERQRLQRRRRFSVFEHLTEQDLNETQQGPRSRIRHQRDIFEGGMDCYVMTEDTLPIGSDEDEDGLNSSLERAHNTDPRAHDTDQDGVPDGLEVFGRTRTDPTKRDSDGDGLIDGIEDANWNGSFDPGETNPSEWDSDRDGLCDGLCKVNNGQDLRGEDKNLNGEYEPDEGEYNPRVRDSDGDGVLDEHEVYLCVLNGGDNC